MIRAIIIDDELHAITTLATLLGKIKRVEIVAKCSNTREAKEAIGRYKPDIVFLDVELSGSSGFQLLEDIADHKFDVVFTTAFEQYALKAIKASALDYLMKPLDQADIEAALAKHESRKNNNPVIQQVDVLFEHYQKRNQVKNLALPTQDGIMFIAIDEVIRLESDSNYTNFYLTGGRKLVISRTLKEYEDILSAKGFCRIHNSHIINLSYLDKYFKGNAGYVRMKDGSTADVSRIRKEEFLRILNAT